MSVLKNILIWGGAIFLALVLLLVILGIKIVGTVLFWIFCVVAVIWLIVWIAYLLGKRRGEDEG